MDDFKAKIANLSKEKRQAFIAELLRNKKVDNKKTIDYSRDFEYKFNSESPFDFTLHESTPGDPGPGYVQIKAKAVSLNFRDVMIATKQYPDSPGVPANMGSDYAGIVTKVGKDVTHIKPGDEIIGLLVGHSESNGELRHNCHFAKTINIHQKTVVSKPRNLTFIESSCIPTVFLTSYIGLVELGRLEENDKVLIHTASGGVGLSALQIATWKKAEIYTTVGTFEKRQFLKQSNIEHVYNSRNDDFAKALNSLEVKLDIILNTLSGDLMIEGLKLLRPFGRFIHIDKKDIASGLGLNLQYLINSIAFQFLDISQLFLNPSLIVSSLQKVVELYESETFQPLHHSVYHVSELKRALTAMSRGTHIGKLVIKYD